MKRAMVLMALASLTVVATMAPAGADHSWNGYHWERDSNPFGVVVGDNVGGAWDGHLVGAAGDWARSGVLDTTVVAGGTSGGSCNPNPGRVEVCSAAYGLNGWLGLATVWATGGHIGQATVKLNDSYFNSPTYNDPHARRHVMCQEIGHALGLAHRPGQTCMDDHNGLWDPRYTGPDAHDYAHLDAVYDHEDRRHRRGGLLSLAVPRFQIPELRIPLPRLTLPRVSDPVIGTQASRATILRISRHGKDLLVLQFIVPAVVAEEAADDGARAREGRSARPPRERADAPELRSVRTSGSILGILGSGSRSDDDDSDSEEGGSLIRFG